MAPTARALPLAGLAIGLGAAGVLGARTVRRALRPEGYDLTAYLDAARALAHGESPYWLEEPFPFLYPPFFAVGMMALAWLPYLLSVLAWYVAGVAAHAWTARVAWRRDGAGGGGAATVYGALFGLLTLRPLASSLSNGQVNTLLVACAVASALALARGRQRGAGALLALAVCVKLVPAILLAPFALRRAARTIAWAAAIGLALCALPGLFVGGDLPELYAGFARQVRDMVALHTSAQGSISIAGDGSASYFGLHGLLATLAPALGDSAAARGAAATAVLALLVALDLGLLHAARRASVPARATALPAAACYLAGALLLIPMGQTHHLLLESPALAIACAFAVGPRRGRGAVRSVLAVHAACALLSMRFPGGPFELLAITAAIGAAWLAARARLEAAAPR